jgi:hypothetical protein
VIAMALPDDACGGVVKHQRPATAVDESLIGGDADRTPFAAADGGSGLTPRPCAGAAVNQGIRRGKSGCSAGLTKFAWGLMSSSRHQ